MFRSALPLLLLTAGSILVWAAEFKKAGSRSPDSKDKDYGGELPRIPPREPAEALKTFQTRPGFHVELVAAEPLLKSPVALDIDEQGRMFVAEYPEYNGYADNKPHGRGRIVMLEDTKGDGHYDKSTVFAENVDIAVAVACWDGGLLVGAPPDLLYFKDTDGDGKADVRRVVYTGFGMDRAGEGQLNSFRWGLDNRFHVSTNLDGGNIRPGNKPAAKPVSVRGYNLLLNPRSDGLELTSGGGQHGMSMDDWGRTFVCGNSDPYSLMVYDSAYLARNPFLQAPNAAVNIAPAGKFTKLHRISPVEPWRALRTRLRSQGIVPGSDEGGSPSGFFTGGTGVTVYRGDAYPSEYRGNLFVGDVANNVVHRARLQPSGVSLTALPAEKDVEFLASRDNWFRPVQFVNAPDGCLWVIDMYRELIEGAAFLPPQILKHMDVGAGMERGRIYRVAPDGFKPPKRPALGMATSAELVALLEHPNAWHRETACRLLYQRQDRTVIPALDQMVVRTVSPLARVHALYAMDGLNALTPRLIRYGLWDPDPSVRIHGLRLAEKSVDDADVADMVMRLVEDPDLQVRYQLAFSLGAFPGVAATRALKGLALADGADPWFRLAIFSSANGRMGDLFGMLLADQRFRGTKHGPDFLAALAGLIGVSGLTKDATRVFEGAEVLAKTDALLAKDLVRQMVSKQPSLANQLSTTDGAWVRSMLLESATEARRTAVDTKKAVPARVAAIRLLGLSTFSKVESLLSELLASRQPPEVQSAAIETLARFSEPAAASAILKAWPGLSPKVRATAAEALFARPAWIQAFLDAVEKGKVARADVDPARLSLLKTYPDTQVRSRAARIFAGTGLARRNDVVAAYQKALRAKGDAGRGKLLFKTHCSACHQLEGVGTQVGADLKAIRDQGIEAVMLNILDPNREVKPQFLTYVLETKNGRVLTGMITTETANSITVRRADGVEETVLRLQIEELRSTGLSFMPEGLEKQIDVTAMSDLLAYLMSTK